MPCKDVVIVNKIFKARMATKVEEVVETKLVQVVPDIVVMVLVTNSYAGVDRSTYQTVLVQDLNLTLVVDERNSDSKKQA